jgi:hypothetical protein
MIYLTQGDLGRAQGLLTSVPKGADVAALLATFAVYWDLSWALTEEHQAQLLGLGPTAFDDDRAVWASVQTQIYWLRKDTVRARAFADSARVLLQQQLLSAPNDAQRHVFLGLALAYLGDKAGAVRTGTRGLELTPITKDAMQGAYLQHQVARIHILVGEYEKALDLLEPLLENSYYLSPGWLQIDPTFDPLRGHPRFRRLLQARR